MQNQPENVILFPKWRTILEEESLQALKEKRYEEALSKLDKLISYQVNSHEIIIGKLMCLMELGRYTEAQDLCEDLLRFKNENYYHYLHIYLTILFQTNQYDLLMEQVEYEFSTGSIPSIMKDQFQQLYDMSGKMKTDLTIEKSTTYLDNLLIAINQNNHVEQWRLIENLRKTRSLPNEQVISYLVNEKVHPVTKTAIFHWFQDMGFSQNVDIHKMGLQINIKPSEVEELNSQTIIKQTLLLIGELEQKNPSLFELLEKLLFRYAYVRFPIMPPSDDVLKLAEALKNIGEQYLNIHTKSKDDISDSVKYYMEEIKMCESLYLSIIEE